jgi:hypothetical protein
VRSCTRSASAQPPLRQQSALGRQRRHHRNQNPPILVGIGITAPAIETVVRPHSDPLGMVSAEDRSGSTLPAAMTGTVGGILILLLNAVDRLFMALLIGFVWQRTQRLASFGSKENGRVDWVFVYISGLLGSGADHGWQHCSCVCLWVLGGRVRDIGRQRGRYVAR